MIICDHREKRSGIPEMLIKEGVVDDTGKKVRSGFVEVALCKLLI